MKEIKKYLEKLDRSYMKTEDLLILTEMDNCIEDFEKQEFLKKIK